MIWDNFSSFGTNCLMLATYIRAHVMGSRLNVVTLRDQMVRVAIFHNEGVALYHRDSPVPEMAHAYGLRP